jgi:peptidoglycan/xylan/chitin deacetylase (PgdA/CDA1 family)
VAAALRRAGIEHPPPVRFFRPPFGVVTGATEEAVADTGLEIIEWTVSVEDWRRGQTAAGISDRILGLVRPGDIIVLHDGNGAHQDSLERCTDRIVVAATVRVLLPALAARGLRVAPLAELLGLDVPDSSLTRPAAGH